MNITTTQQNIAHAAVAACRDPSWGQADKLADPMAGCASPAAIAGAAAAARGTMQDTALLLASFRRLAAVRNDHELRLLCINLETVLSDKGGM